MKILKARLYEKERKEKEEKLEELHTTKKEIAWGSQIRSYVMHPYRMVKDHRTNLVIHDVDRVMDGEIDDLMKTYLLNSSSTQWDLKKVWPVRRRPSPTL